MPTPYFCRYEDRRHKRWLYKTTGIMQELIVQLSMYYKRKLEGGTGSWDPPTSFERKTTKYWIDAEDVTKVKLHIIKSLPILELTSTS